MKRKEKKKEREINPKNIATKSENKRDDQNNSNLKRDPKTPTKVKDNIMHKISKVSKRK